MQSLLTFTPWPFYQKRTSVTRCVVALGPSFLSTLEHGEQDKGCLCGMLMAEMSSLDDEGVRRVHLFLQGNVDAIQSILDQGANDGSLNGKGSPDIVLATLEGGLLMARCECGPQRFREMIHGLMRLLS